MALLCEAGEQRGGDSSAARETLEDIQPVRHAGDGERAGRCWAGTNFMCSVVNVLSFS